jgi:hypothetical protein
MVSYHITAITSNMHRLINKKDIDIISDDVIIHGVIITGSVFTGYLYDDYQQVTVFQLSGKHVPTIHSI